MIACTHGSANVLAKMSQKGNPESPVCSQNPGIPKTVPSEVVNLNYVLYSG